MLRRADNISVNYRKGGLFRKPRLEIYAGRNAYYREVTGKWEEWQAVIDRAREGIQVFPVVYAGGRMLWQWRDRYYWESDGLEARQVQALLIQRELRDQRRIANAEAAAYGGMQNQPSNRAAIPQDVQQAVWIRDNGRCQLCGTRSEIQFGHLVPVAFGGSNEAENVQLECGPCNRKKGAGF